MIIPSSEGISLYGKAFPSYVAFTKDGQRLVGEAARRQAVANPEGTVSGIQEEDGHATTCTRYSGRITSRRSSRRYCCRR